MARPSWIEKRAAAPNLAPLPPLEHPVVLTNSEQDSVIHQERDKRHLLPADTDKDDGYPRKIFNPQKAVAVMAATRFFLEFEKVMPGLIDSLSLVALAQYGKTGDVLFRQGDPAEDCYAIVRGEVGVYIGNYAQQKSPRELGNEVVRDDPDDILQEAERVSGLSCCRRRRKFLGTMRAKARDPTFGDRYLTAEGHNTWNKNSKIGECVVHLGTSDVFGELGLLSDKPRAATIKCITPCKFLVIDRTEFQAMFGGKFTEHTKLKYSFFHDHVPGFKNLQNSHRMSAVAHSGRVEVEMYSHPADSFERIDVSYGHEFLSEGMVSLPVLFVIVSGEVSFIKNIRSFPRMTPPVLLADNWTTPQSDDVDLKLEAKKLNRPLPTCSQCWHVLKAGQLFASLGFFGLPFAEAYSAQVTSDICELYSLSDENLKKMPKQVLEAVKNGAIHTMRPLLRQSAGFMSCMSIPSQPEDYHVEELV